MLKENLELSNRQIADQVKVSHPTVATVRKEMEQAGDVVKVSTLIDTKGRKQPVRKSAKRTKSGKAIIKARDKAWADIQADPNLRREIETKLAKTPPMPDKDKLLAMVEQAMVGDKAFQAAIEALLVKATGRTLKDDRDDDDGVDEVLRAIADKPLSGEHRVTPLEDAIRNQEQDSGDPIPPPENAPSVVPADTRTADEIMGDLPEELRRRRERAEQLAAWHRRD